MTLLKAYYKIFKKGQPIPYYANYSILKILWIPIRKYLNVVIIPNIPFNILRILMYRLIGYKIGKNVFIGMKCYLDDLEPRNITIGDNTLISYGVYFSLHGKNQSRSSIDIKKGTYIGMASRIIAKNNGLTIGEFAVIGAGILVIKDVNANETHAGVPAAKIN